MSRRDFVARIDRTPSFFAVGRSADDLRNVFVSLFVSRSYPLLTVRCFCRDGWHAPDAEHYFRRKWENAEVDWDAEVDRDAAAQIVSGWGYALDDGLRLLARSSWSTVSALDSELTAQAFLAQFAFARDLVDAADLEAPRT